MRRLGKTYVCDACGDEYEYVTDGSWTEEHAIAEYAAAFGNDPIAEPAEEAAIVCSDCYPKLMALMGKGDRDADAS